MADLAFLTFTELLDRYFTDPGVERELSRRYATRLAVLVVDLTRMARRTEEHGITYALAVANAADHAMRPAWMARDGRVVKRVADTAFVVFDRAESALQAALDGQRALHAFRPGGGEFVHACMGLGFGDALLVPGVDVFGAEVNRAFILGEDIAKGGEVLATPAFLAALGGPPSGVGAFEAPEERTTVAGFPFHVLSDYR